MQTKTQARAHARALAGAAVVGSAMTLILGGVYTAGASARAAEDTAGSPREADGAGLQSASVPLVQQFRRTAAESLSGPNPVKPAQPFKAKTSGPDFDCLSTAVYFEARGEGSRGQEAVAQVILNRVRHPSFPKTVCGVVFQGCQFSFVCDGSMRRGKEASAWQRARSVASRALAGAVMAEVGASTHFHARRVAPNWGNLVRVATVGSHIFYRSGGRAGRSAFRGSSASALADASEAQGAMEPAPAYTILGPSSGGETAGLQRISTAPAPSVPLTLEPVKLQPVAPPAFEKPAVQGHHAPAPAPASPPALSGPVAAGSSAPS